MSSAYDRNYALQQVRYFTAADLEANKQGQYSQPQLDRFKAERDFIQNSVGKYENKTPIVSIIFGVGFLFFVVILYLFGLFDSFQTMLGSLFLPVMAGALIFIMLFIFVIIPRSYKSSVEMYKSMGTPLSERPLSSIQVIEARADAYKSQAGINRRGHSVSSQVSYILQMDGIKFHISEELMNAVENKSLYRVYCTNDGGVWTLLSMEALD